MEAAIKAKGVVMDNMVEKVQSKIDLQEHTILGINKTIQNSFM